MLRLTLALGALLSATSAHALTYIGSASAGSTSATYTIVTDGTFGTLSLANITSVSGTVTSASQTQSFTNGNIIILAGSPLSATASQLVFDTALLGGFAIGNSGAAFPVICWAGTGISCGGEPSPSLVIGADYPSDSEFTGTSGTLVIASVAGVVPEPAAWLLMIGGFGLVGSALRRRRKVSVSFA